MTASTAPNTRSVSGARRLIGRRAIVALAIGASATLGLSACGAGQIAQTSSQASGVTGASAVSANGALSVLDVQLLYPSTEDARVQDKLQISFVAVNADPVNSDTLESIVVKGQELKLGDGDFTIAPNSAIGTPTLPAFSNATGATPTATAAPAATLEGVPTQVTVGEIDSAKVGAVGESTPVVFNFAKAGAVELPTPIGVWHDVPRDPNSVITSQD